MIPTQDTALIPEVKELIPTVIKPRNKSSTRNIRTSEIDGTTKTTMDGLGVVIGRNLLIEETQGMKGEEECGNNITTIGLDFKGSRKSLQGLLILILSPSVFY